MIKDRYAIKMTAFARLLSPFGRRSGSRIVRRPLQVALSLLLLLPTAFALALPPGFTEEVVVTGLNDPTNIITMPDGYMITVEKEGRLRRFNPANNIPMSATSILKISVSTVAFDRERGAASIALDPDYATNGYIYLYYTQKINGNRNRISRFKMVNNVANPNTEVLVWEDNEPYSDCCHYGGGLDFGPDDMLYLTTGEEFDGPQAQDLSRAGGKIIRLDPSTIDAQGPWVRGASNNHLIPNDNPFVDGAGPNLDEIWARGLRNPFRAHWDIPNNRFYISEVGGNIQATASEDLHLGKKGANYGWPYCEGVVCTGLPGSITPDPPVYHYGHEGVTPAGGAIAAGFVYRHKPSFTKPYPNSYDEVFFFADYATGDIKYLVFNPDGSVASVNDFAAGVGSPVALELGPDGSLYAVDYIAERVTRFRYTSGNQPPVITSATGTPDAGTPPLSVTFSATATDPENDALTYQWNFGDGNQQNGATVTHTYNQNGSYNAFVRVLDSANSTSSAFIPINVGTPPVANISAPLDGAMFVGGETINFAGNVANPDASKTYTYSWDIDFIHNAHTHPTASLESQTGEFDINVTGHDYHDTTGYRLVLTVTDQSGLFGTDTVEIFPQKIDLDLVTVPAGLSVFVDALPVTTPSSYDTIVNFIHNVSVPQTLCENGISYEYVSWSDGGARSHSITMPAANLQLTATFSQAGTCAQLPANGLVAHYESDNGVNSNGTDLTGWSDLSGSGNDLTIVGGDPSVLDNALNGFPIVSFDGVGDVMRRTAPLTGFPAGGSDRTMVTVVNYRSTGYGGVAMGAPSTNQAFGLIVGPTGKLGVQAWGGNDRLSATNGTGAGWLRQSAVVSSNQMTHFLNGAQIGSASITYNTNLTDFVVGAEIDLSPNIDMQVAAILVYNRALSAAELGQVDSYLQSKYFNGGGGNQAPVARNDASGTTQGGSVDISVLANDTDSDDGLDTGSILVTQPGNGTAVALANGKVQYTHNGGASTVDSFTYTVKDISGQLSNIATVSLSISGGGTGGIGDVPATGLVAYFEADRGVNVGAENVVFGWEDQSAQGNDLSATGNPRLLDSAGPNATPAISFNGTSDFLDKMAPSGVATGATDRSMYMVVNYEGTGFGGAAYGTPTGNKAFGLVVSASGNLAVQGWGGQNDFVSTTVGTGAGWLTQSAIIGNNQGVHYLDDVAIGTFNHTYATTANRMLVGAELNAGRFVDMQVSALIVYNKALNAAEHAQVLAYLDQKYGSGGGTGNQAPVAQNDSGTVVHESSVLLSVLSNDSDADGQLNVNSVQIMTAPLNGTAVVNTDGTINYTHTVGNTATSDSFTYRVSDNLGAPSNVATVSLSITGGGGNPGGIGDVPANGLAAYYEADRGVNMAGGVVSTWEDQSGNGNTLTSTGDPQMATGGNSQAVIDFDGNGDLLARAGLNGVATGAADRSMYVVARYDGVGFGGAAYGTATANKAFGLVVSSAGDLTVQGWGSSGGSSNDFISTSAGTGTNWLVQSAVIKNNQGAHYRNGTQIDTYTHAYATTANRLVVGAELGEPPYTDMQVGAVIIYNRALSAVEHIQVVTYLASKYGAMLTTQLEESPVASDDTGTVVSESSVLLSVLSNDSDADGQLDTSSVQIAAAPANGTAVVNTDGSISYTHTVGNTATGDSFSYQVRDEQGNLSNAATVTLSITGGAANASPIARNDSGSVMSDSSIELPVLSNDNAVDGELDTGSVQIQTAPEHGQVQVNTDGTITYTHAFGNAATSDSFTYQVMDDQGTLSNEATVTLTITGNIGGGNLGSIGNVPATGLAAYYEADRGVTTIGGGVVTAWEDQSGNGNTLASVGNPKVVTGSNSQLVIDFDGTDDLLARAGLAAVSTGAADRSMYVVARYDGVGFGGVAYGTPTSNRAFGLIVSSAGDLTVQGWGGANDFTSTSAGTGADWLVQSAIVENNQGAHYVSSTLIDTFAHAYATTANRLVIGAELGEPPYMDMQVAAVIIYDRALSPAEHEQVISYLDDKYGTSEKVGADNSPVARNDSGTVLSESSVQLSVLANDSDADGELDVSSVHIVLTPANGVAVVNSDGSIGYTHAVGNTATSDSFTYRVSDDQGTVSNAATVTLTIAGGGAGDSGGIGHVPANGLAAYYEADRGVSAGSDGVVTAWADQSGNGNTLTSVGNPQVALGPNSEATIAFDGDGDAMLSGALSGFPLGASNRTAFLVASYDSEGSGGFGYGLRKANRAFGLSVEAAGLLRVNGYARDYVSSSAGTGAGWLIQSAVVSANQLVHSVNGVEVDSASNTYNTGAGPLVLGADLDQSPYVQMQVAALLVYDRALTTDEQIQVLNYLQGKYF